MTCIRAIALGASFLLGVGGCAAEQVLGNGPRPPYLAVVILTDSPNSAVAQGPYRIRIRELSGGRAVDSTLRVTTRDTTVLSVAAETYQVDLDEVPSICGVRESQTQTITVLANTNTTLIRFTLACRNALTMITQTFGRALDSTYAYVLRGPAAAQRVGRIAANDTILLDDLKGGDWDLELRQVGTNCTVTSDGGERARATLTDAGGATIRFVVRCSEEKLRPRILHFAGSYDSTIVGFALEVHDAGRDIDGYVWTITDCRGRNLLPNGPVQLYGFSGLANVSFSDTARIVGGFEVDLPLTALNGNCQSIWLSDGLGNTTPVVEIPLRPRVASRSPRATMFNARLNGTATLHIDLQVEDPDRDYVGALTTYLLRDGIVSIPTDGKFDQLLFHAAGTLGVEIPDIPLNIGYGEWSDYYGVRVVLVDRAGNLARLTDYDLLR